MTTLCRDWKREGIIHPAIQLHVCMLVRWVDGHENKCEIASVHINGAQDCLPAFRDVYIISEALMGPNAE